AMIGKGRKSRQELSECAVYFETDNWISPITYCCDSGARCSKINAEPHNVYRNVKPTQIHTRNRARSLFVAHSNRKLLKIEVFIGVASPPHTAQSERRKRHWPDTSQNERNHHRAERYSCLCELCSGPGSHTTRKLGSRHRRWVRTCHSLSHNALQSCNAASFDNVLERWEHKSRYAQHKRPHFCTTWTLRNRRRPWVRNLCLLHDNVRAQCTSQIADS